MHSQNGYVINIRNYVLLPLTFYFDSYTDDLVICALLIFLNRLFFADILFCRYGLVQKIVSGEFMESFCWFWERIAWSRGWGLWHLRNFSNGIWTKWKYLWLFLFNRWKSCILDLKDHSECHCKSDFHEYIFSHSETKLDWSRSFLKFSNLMTI